MRCVVPGCKNSFGSRTYDVSFHKFPQNETECNLWKNALKIPDLKIHSSTRICSVHFPQEYIIKTARCINLRKDAIPKLIEAPFKPNTKSYSEACADLKSQQKDACVYEASPVLKVQQSTSENTKFSYIKIASDFSAVHREVSRSTSPDSSAAPCSYEYLESESDCEEMASDFSAIHREMPSNSILDSATDSPIYELLDSDSDIKEKIDENMIIYDNTPTKEPTEAKALATKATNTGLDWLCSIKLLEMKIAKLQETIKRKNQTIRNLKAKLRRRKK